MAINLNRPERWKADIAESVDFYNQWFMQFAPKTFRDARKEMTGEVEKAVEETDNLFQLTPALLRREPSVLSVLRMATAPPIARDRLSGLAYVERSVINRMEKKGKLPTMKDPALEEVLSRLCGVITELLDHDIFPWLEAQVSPTDEERDRAATIIADRLSGATANPIIRNAQEQRQLKAIGAYLTDRGYKHLKKMPSDIRLQDMEPGTFTFRRNVVVGDDYKVNIPVDAVIQPLELRPSKLPILVEAKSAGDFTNTNKRRKEEAKKMQQLLGTYGDEVVFILFLNGYFDSGYLGYEAAEGIDWVWEHRIEDFAEIGI